MLSRSSLKSFPICLEISCQNTWRLDHFLTFWKREQNKTKKTPHTLFILPASKTKREEKDCGFRSHTIHRHIVKGLALTGSRSIVVNSALFALFLSSPAQLQQKKSLQFHSKVLLESALSAEQFAGAPSGWLLFAEPRGPS